MLIKRKRFKQNQLFLKYYFKKIEIHSLITKSLWKNHYFNPLDRFACTVFFSTPSKLEFFPSYQKLICLQLLDKKVPSSKFLFSRFFLNKQLNSLKITNVTK